MLREAREHLGLSVADVAGQIKFAPRQIEALEADDFKQSARSCILARICAQLCQDFASGRRIVIGEHAAAKAATPELVPSSVDVPFPNEQANRQQNQIWLGAAALLAVLVAGFAVWHFKTPLKQEQQQAKEQISATKVETPVALPAEAKIVSEPLILKSSTIEPSPSRAEIAVFRGGFLGHEAKTAGFSRVRRKLSTLVASSAQAAQKLRRRFLQRLLQLQPELEIKTEELRLVFGEESWTEIKDKDGNIISSQINPAGSELHVQGNPPFSMLIGHAASASLCTGASKWI